ncbi:histidine kinase dimerization/phosphoacceptor domain -containing protein [Sphingomonas crocodyli]|uniref:histidine kinase n=1 Tax=Sphingomonas crocodyli TaxID=1979270 RepID=A0A437LWL4_9SPHN|nr:histidine kinase dimerization/phosphoacceptor domain -containing protein [Sphingomonas crocodyli]RVT89759.1 response regulator [Sphingomonas crocodyli]
MSDPAPHILYIDDDAGIRRLADKALSRRGFTVSLAESGPQGLAMAREGAFDLIAVDHYMPGQDGLTTINALQAVPDCPPIVYVTGSEESRIAVAALKAGAADYVVKAVGDDFFDLLASSFRQALERVALLGAKEAVEQELRASNARLETLLKEVNHRVANSLQLVSAFVRLQGSSIADAAAREALTETEQRIQAIAHVHRRLYSSDDVEYVAMDDYLDALVAELEATWSAYDGHRPLRLTAEPVRLKTDRAVSLGIIVNELVSNACKYAYAVDTRGEVRITLSASGDRFVLSVEDDGAGLPADGKIRGTGLGTKLIRSMASSLQAEISYDSAHKGVRALVSAPL